MNKDHYIIFFLILTLYAGIISNIPYLDYQPLLSQGDHGRDLYCFKMTAEGSQPFRDYWWQYGPLMPYYYALFFKLFGVSIQSVLLGKAIIRLLCGVVIYFLGITIMSPAMAFIAAFWFYVFMPDFFYTYSHIGGLPFLMLVLLGIFKYSEKPAPQNFYLGLSGVFFLSLIRLNLAVSSLIVLAGAALKKNPAQKTRIVAASLMGLGLSACVYLFFTLGLNLSDLKKCLPYLSDYRSENIGLAKALSNLWSITVKNFTASLPRLAFSVILFSSIGRIVYLFKNNQFTPEEKNKILFTVAALAAFLLLSSHEYFISGTIYRLFWLIPGLIVLFLYLIDTATKSLRPLVYALILLLLFSISASAARGVYRIARFEKQLINLFEYGKNKIYVANFLRGQPEFPSTLNDPLQTHWITTVRKTADFLEENVPPGQPILAIPYDAIYYFLTSHGSAVYPQAFFRYIKIGEEEEKKMIRQLEEKNVTFIVLSNRSASWEKHLGVLGEDYCPVLARYISENFTEAARFGDWQHPADFTRNHGTKILKRK